MKCLVCGKEKVSEADKRCKLCGMRTEEEHASKSHNFVFCCTECMNRFGVILENSNEKEKEEILTRNIVI